MIFFKRKIKNTGDSAFSIFPKNIIIMTMKSEINQTGR
jgi:hypothetical protein